MTLTRPHGRPSLGAMFFRNRLPQGSAHNNVTVPCYGIDCAGEVFGPQLKSYATVNILAAY